MFKLCHISFITQNKQYKHCETKFKQKKIFREIEECYDQIVHPQKRKDIKLALDVAMTRMLQLKRSLIQYTPMPGLWNYINLDKYANIFQLSPEELEIPVPKYFLEEDISFRRYLCIFLLISEVLF